MKYLKLFEDHKETSDKLKELEDKHSKEKIEIVNQYKSIIDEVMYDISDNYETTSEIEIIPEHREYGNWIQQTFVTYKIKFTVDSLIFDAKYGDLIGEEFLKSLQEVVERLKDAYDITHDIKEITHDGFKLPGKLHVIYPFDFHESKRMIKNYIELKEKTLITSIPKEVLSGYKFELTISF
jgi:hypothetical protein